MRAKVGLIAYATRADAAVMASLGAVARETA